MSVAAVSLIALPIAYNAIFAVLAARFDYPDILRRPTDEVLERFIAGGAALIRWWEAFMLTALAFTVVPVLLVGQLPGADGDLLRVSAIVGAFAGLVQALGLLRWGFVVPHLARAHAQASTDAERVAQRAIFEALHRYLGVGVGEHLGYGLTGLWTVLASAAVIQSSAVPAAIGWLGLVPGVALLVGAREFVGAHEQHGWRPAEAIVPIAYVGWSLWLVALGIALVV
ncbi:MAG: DUF4386 domain-containing protein [Solirubrobacteraceae bacterium]|nr:DUF4386 domain-containing protein [Patulibacter sp.]